MNKSIFIKLLIALLIIYLMVNMFYYPSSYATSDIIKDGKDFLGDGKTVTTVLNTKALKTTSNNIYNTLLAIAIMVAVIVAMVLGIQFMVASADEKAKVKEALMPFVVGCIVVFGSFTIWKVVVTIGNSAEDSVKSVNAIKGEYDETEDIYTYYPDYNEINPGEDYTVEIPAQG